MISSAILFLLHDALFFLSYVSNRSTFPRPLPAKEEKELLIKAEEGSSSARSKLIEHNLRLVAHIARKYTVAGYDSDDLVSIGTIGLIKGVNTYKRENGTQLSTYCARCIENEILMTLRASQKWKGDMSLEEPIGTDSEGNEVSLIDILGSKEPMVADTVEQRVSLERITSLIHTQLPKRERMVVELRYGLADGNLHSQQEIASILGISRSYVSRIEKKALELLKSAFEKPVN